MPPSDLPIGDRHDRVDGAGCSVPRRLQQLNNASQDSFIGSVGRRRHGLGGGAFFRHVPRIAGSGDAAKWNQVRTRRVATGRSLLVRQPPASRTSNSRGRQTAGFRWWPLCGSRDWSPLPPGGEISLTSSVSSPWRGRRNGGWPQGSTATARHRPTVRGRSPASPVALCPARKPWLSPPNRIGM